MGNPSILRAAARGTDVCTIINLAAPTCAAETKTETTEMKKYMTVEMQNGTVWGVQVLKIAVSRATHYANEFNGDVQRSLKEDTMPLFEEDESSITDWAENNMDWSDFSGEAVLLLTKPFDYQDGWINGEKGFSDGN